MAPATRQRPGAWPEPHGGPDMPNRTAGSDDPYLRSAQLLAERIDEFRDVLVGVSALRARGDEAAKAVEAVLEVRSIKQLRLGFELLETLIQGHVVDPDTYFASRIG